MNRKLVKTVFGITLGAIMLISTVAASGNPTEGYEVYKHALKSLSNSENATISFSIDASDNGKKIFIGNLSAEVDLKGKSASALGKLEANGSSKEFNLFRNSEKEYFQFGTENTVYERPYQPKSDKRHDRKHFAGRESSKKSEMGEKFVDLVMGDFKKQFEVSDSDYNTQIVNFKLSESEIPEVLNLMLLAKLSPQDSSNSTKYENCPLADKFLNMGMEEIRPNLVEDIALKSFELEAEIGSLGIKNQTLSFEFSGKDKNGEYHDLSLTANLSISDINDTSVDKFDLTGKEIIAVDDDCR